MATTTKRMKVSGTDITPILLAQAVPKIPSKVNQVERAEVDRDDIKAIALRFHYAGLHEPGYIISDANGTNCYHYCEASANGNNCNHWVYAGAVAHELGMELKKTYHAKDPSDYEHLIRDFVDFEDISSQFGVVPPIPSGGTASTAASSSAAPSTAPVVSTKTATPITKKRNWSEGYNEVLEYLKGEGVTGSMLMEIVELRKSIYENVQLTTMATEPVKPDLPYMGSYVGRAFRHIIAGKDLILIGDKGCGKDTLIATIAWVLGLPVYLQPGNANETKESIVGDRSFAKGEVFFDLSPFATSVQYGGISNYTELNMIPGQVTAVFHPVLDENRQLPTLKGAIPRHKHHLFIGSMNVGEQYAGVSLTNGALMDRFAILEMPYSLEFKELLIRKSGLTDNKPLKFLEDVKMQIDELIATEGTGERSKTIRGYIDAAKHLKKYGVNHNNKVEAVEDFIINKTEDKIEKFKMRDRLRQSVFPDLPKTKEEEDYENGSF
ncbi:ATPase [Paenibacillus oralis]|uniref:ATPase n=1 Tax=Paenibacillus oralis TaxID=2490856 RepID=A0A3P3TAB1_9BACL|nr:AAA family ATPase [Paenibacillus oralis]RRJ54986.1 ATPase [Paenibacillus oralis]